jgi:hypothetical protein
MASSAADIATASTKGDHSDRGDADQEESGVTFDVHASAHVPSAPLVPLRLVARPQPPAGAAATRQGSGPVAKIEDVTAEGKLANPAASVVVVEENVSQYEISSGTQCAFIIIMRSSNSLLRKLCLVNPVSASTLSLSLFSPSLSLSLSLSVCLTVLSVCFYLSIYISLYLSPTEPFEIRWFALLCI